MFVVIKSSTLLSLFILASILANTLANILSNKLANILANILALQFCSRYMQCLINAFVIYAEMKCHTLLLQVVSGRTAPTYCRWWVRGLLALTAGGVWEDCSHLLQVRAARASVFSATFSVPTLLLYRLYYIISRDEVTIARDALTERAPPHRMIK